MAIDYVLNWSNDTLKTPITVTANTINTSSTSLSLIGQGTANYGEILHENLIRLMENFASDVQPANPTIGQLWYDSTSGVLKVYDGTDFVNQKLSTEIPVNPNPGDLVYNSNTGALQLWDGTQWQDIATISDITSANSTILAHISDPDVHLTSAQNLLLDGINSTITSAEINLLEGLTGNIQSQIDTVNLAISDTFSKTEADARYLGISAKAADSNLLDGLDSTQFLRSDVSDTANGYIDFAGDMGVLWNIYLESQKHVISANDGGGNFNIRVGNNFTNGITEDGFAAHYSYSQLNGAWQWNGTTASQLIGETPVWQNNMTLTSAGELQVRGNVIGGISDERLKDISGPITNALETIANWRAVHYTPNSIAESYGYDSNTKEIGLIVQDIEQDYPEVVKNAPINTADTDYKTLQYDKVTAILVAALQDQININKDLQNQINEIKSKIG